MRNQCLYEIEFSKLPGNAGMICRFHDTAGRAILAPMSASESSEAAKANKPDDEVQAAFRQFAADFEPFEATAAGHRMLNIFVDKKSGARFCECHIKASKLIRKATTNVPLDPEEQPEYRANRELVTDAAAFARMQEDAAEGRSFSNIVAEYTHDFDPDLPLKIIGGQHRFKAIETALAKGVDEYHGVKVYLSLNMDQRLDVQLISNTNIAISSDLYDRMQETFKGPELRNWAQKAGLLAPGQDFADRGGRGRQISVQAARTFILNYYKGKSVEPKKFDSLDTTPILSTSGSDDASWNELRETNKQIWADSGLARAASEYAKLIRAQRDAFANSNPKPPVDYPEKTSNAAVMSAWAYVAGMLHNNAVRLQRHYDLASAAGRDPLNAAQLAKGRHRSDAANYRGLGYRTDIRERGRLVELFFQQADDGRGITKNAIDVAIAKHHAKLALLDVQKAQAKVVG